MPTIHASIPLNDSLVRQRLTTTFSAYVYSIDSRLKVSSFQFECSVDREFSLDRD